MTSLCMKTNDNNLYVLKRSYIIILFVFIVIGSNCPCYVFLELEWCPRRSRYFFLLTDFTFNLKLL